MNVLLIDFCATEPLLALVLDGVPAAAEHLQERGAAASWLAALKRLLHTQTLSIQELHAIGVVAGPGSFTGVRTGLAAAKGICEAASLQLATVSRLAVLAHAAGSDKAVAILHAARGQVYLRTPPACGMAPAEMMVELPHLEHVVGGRPVVVAEARLLESLAAYDPRLTKLGPEQIFPLVHQVLTSQPTELYTADAHYLHEASEIYRTRTGEELAGQAPR